MTFLMFDTVTPSAVGRIASTSPDAVAGYVDGRFRDIAELERLYPQHRHLSIAVFPWDDADCLDIETGDARPTDAPGWLRRQHARGIARPWLYANTSTWPAVKAALQLAGIGRQEFVKWRADYDFIAELQSDDDAKQFSDHWEGRNLDASICRDNVFEVMRARPKPHHRRRLPILQRRKVRRVAPRRKVVAGGVGGGLGIAVLHALAGAGVHVTPTEAASISTAVGILLGYLTPSSR